MKIERRSFFASLAALLPFAKVEPPIIFDDFEIGPATSYRLTGTIVSGGTCRVAGGFVDCNDYYWDEITFSEEGPTIRKLKRENGIDTELSPARPLEESDGYSIERM